MGKSFIGVFVQIADTCKRMNPLIDQELEAVDREHMDLTALNAKLMDAFSMYHGLMKEAPVYGYSLKTMNVPQQGVAGQYQPGVAAPVRTVGGAVGFWVGSEFE